jgi:hypothetical protein
VPRPAAREGHDRGEGGLSDAPFPEDDRVLSTLPTDVNQLGHLRRAAEEEVNDIDWRAGAECVGEGLAARDERVVLLVETVVQRRPPLGRSLMLGARPDMLVTR